MSQFDDLSHPNSSRRRTIAIRLGKSLDPEAVPALVAALASERDDQVRASIVLALGATGDEATAELLARLTSLGPREAEAKTAALSRLTSRRATVGWQRGLFLSDLIFEVPIGLERPTNRMFVKAGFPELATEADGQLRCRSPIAVSDLSPLPRWAYTFRLPLCEAAANDRSEAVKALFAQATQAQAWNRWLERGPDAPLPYRLSIEGRKLPKDAFAALLKAARDVCEPAGLVDQPSAYSVELVLYYAGDAMRLDLRPSFVADTRFDYRLKGVSAGINPVVAAAVANLVPMLTKGVVLDPTCGSATLLIERGLIDRESDLVGIDISSEACEAANANTCAAGLSHRVRILNGNAVDPENWRPCGLVLANLPFGNRLGRNATELRILYNGIVDRAGEHLSQDGRLVLYTGNHGLLENTINRQGPFTTLSRQRVQSGGLYVHIAILGRGTRRKKSPRKRRRAKA